MATIAVLVTLIIGWISWTYWLAIPLGFLLYWGAYPADTAGAARIAPAAWVVGPLIALFLIWIGGFAHRLVS